MEYIKRMAEDKFKKLSDFFPVVLVSGPRQIGKKTMLKHLSENENRTYVSLDDLNIRALAKSDPKLFFQTYKTPILIDEAQFAPNLFTYIKIMADKNKQAGEFWLTGSQSYEITKNISESLAGRIGIMNMYSFTQQEILKSNRQIPTNFSFDNLQKLNGKYDNLEINDVFENIFSGGMPKIIGEDELTRSSYFYSYINSYLMRDAMELGKISDSVKFHKFLIACASQVANVVNYANLANASDISQPTAKEWLETLQGMGIVYLIQPYFNNSLKRLTKSPKLYFYDTGLCSYLAKIPSKDSLQVSNFAGAYFENYVINQFVIKYGLIAHAPNIYYYRDTDQNEVDVLLEDFDGITPLEIKLSASPNNRDIGKFKILDKIGKPIKNGGIICLIDNLLPVTDKHCFIPVGVL